jgi:hypothetical protein
LAAGVEGLDDEHAAAAAGARLGEWLRRCIDFDRRFGCRHCQSQEFARSRDRLGAIRAGEQAVVADAMEAFGSTWMRNRRMNSLTSSVIVVYRPGPSIL